MKQRNVSFLFKFAVEMEMQLKFEEASKCSF